MKNILSVAGCCLIIVANAQQSTALKLWYSKSAGNRWENALPVGNGFLGAMVYGNVDTEKVQLNESTVWSGSPNRNDNSACLDSLPVIRKPIFDGKQKEAEQLANRIMVSKTSHGQMFEPVGNLQLVFPGHNNYTNYYRELDIEKATTTTRYTANNITYTRKTLASFPDRVIVVQLTASKANSISLLHTIQRRKPKPLCMQPLPDN